VPTETCWRRALRMGLRADQARAAPPVLLSWGFSQCLAAHLCLHAAATRAASCRRGDALQARRLHGRLRPNSLQAGVVLTLTLADPAVRLREPQARRRARR